MVYHLGIKKTDKNPKIPDARNNLCLKGSKGIYCNSNLETFLMLICNYRRGKTVGHLLVALVPAVNAMFSHLCFIPISGI